MTIAARRLPWIAAGAVLAFPAEAALPVQRVLPSGLAVEIAQGAVQACALHGFPVAAAIVDRAGVLRVLISGDGVKPIDIEAARRKAVTAAALEADTLDLAGKVEAAPAYGRVLMALNADLLLLGGGMPIHAGDDIVGAIGIGGAPGGDKDAACGHTALDAVRARLQ